MSVSCGSEDAYRQVIIQYQLSENFSVYAGFMLYNCVYSYSYTDKCMQVIREKKPRKFHIKPAELLNVAGLVSF